MSECLGDFWGHGQGRAKRVRMVALTVALETRLSLLRRAKRTDCPSLLPQLTRKILPGSRSNNSYNN